jgi:hypothetical protein
VVNAAYSIGLWLKEDGSITDTVEGMPAAQAGIGPGMKLIAVNGRKFSAEILRDTLRQGKSGSSALQLLVENTEYYKTFKLDYHGGEKYPHLVRDEATPDLLSDIIKPHSSRKEKARRSPSFVFCPSRFLFANFAAKRSLPL